MCLGVPGRIISLDENPLGMTMGQVDFGGITKEVCLAWVPEARAGDYVIVHVGFAISKVDEAEAKEVFRLVQEMDGLADLGPPGGGRGAVPGSGRGDAPGGERGGDDPEGRR